MGPHCLHSSTGYFWSWSLSFLIYEMVTTAPPSKAVARSYMPSCGQSAQGPVDQGAMTHSSSLKSQQFPWSLPAHPLLLLPLLPSPCSPTASVAHRYLVVTLGETHRPPHHICITNLEHTPGYPHLAIETTSSDHPLSQLSLMDSLNHCHPVPLLEIRWGMPDGEEGRRETPVSVGHQTFQVPLRASWVTVHILWTEAALALCFLLLVLFSHLLSKCSPSSSG